MERLFLVGHPVGHSKSPAMHNAAYRALGLDWTYELADHETEADAWEFIAERAWRALNVTMPWKRLAIQATNNRSVPARLATGANVLVNWDGNVYADNTDGKGCVSYLLRCGVGFEGASVAVCGTGPTSLAIMHACTVAGAEHIALMGRDHARCAQAIEHYHECLWDQPPCESELTAYAYGDAKAREAIAGADIIVDATPLGMKQGDPAPFDTALLSAGQTVFDVVYGHGTTQLIADARAAGCATYDGSGMLVAQAVETVVDIADITHAFEIPADLDLFGVMADAAGFALS